MSHSVNYTRMYFHRPVWTAENQRFWAILVVVGLLLMTLVLLSMRWSARISPEQINKLIKTRYISFLSQSTFPMKYDSPEVEKDESSTLLDKSIPIGMASESTQSSGITGGKADSVASQSASGFGNDLIYAYGMGVITSAVENVPGYLGINYRSSRYTKPLTLRNEIQVFKSHGEQIQIPLPEAFHFASENGRRDLQETSAVMEMNEIDVKYCFERVYRFDPSFKGYVLLRFTIHPEGYVIPASIKFIKTDIRDPRILDCIRKQIQRWRNFTPIAYEDGNFTVTRKYVF